MNNQLVSWFRNSISARRCPIRRHSWKPRLEQCEDRCTPAIITVTGIGDDEDAMDGEVTLREAVASINAKANLFDVVAVGNYQQNDEIKFQIAGAGVKSIGIVNDAIELSASQPTPSKGRAEQDCLTTFFFSFFF